MEGYMVGKRVFILGSGDIGLIMARRMTLEGATVVGVAEIMPYSNGLPRNMKQCLEDYLSARYGLEVFVKEPASLRQEPEYENIRIDKWQLSVATAPESPKAPTSAVLSNFSVISVPSSTV